MVDEKLLKQLDDTVHRPDILGKLMNMLKEAERRLPLSGQNWVSILVHLDVYEYKVPHIIKSSRVSIFRGGLPGRTERHTNSDQFVCLLQGTADVQTLEDDEWISHIKHANAEAPLIDRWSYVPRNIWHRPMPVGPENWGLVAFHTVLSKDLVDERK